MDTLYVMGPLRARVFYEHISSLACRQTVAVATKGWADMLKETEAESPCEDDEIPLDFQAFEVKTPKLSIDSVHKV